MRLRVVGAALVMVASLVSCDRPSEGVAVVASLYPLAWAAASVGGPDAAVTDLTPPGAEAHDTTLTAAQRAELQTADVVLYLGDIGLQPDVERAIDEADGEVVDMSTAVDTDLAADPHVWLDPVAMRQVVEMTRAALVDADRRHGDAYGERARETIAALDRLDAAYRERLGDCEFHTFVATHEAFGYLAARYGLEQLGIQGLVPESEPTAERIQAVIETIEGAHAAPVVFFENTEEGRTIADSIAVSAGVPTLPLGTLESEPSAGDYLGVMRQNLANLAEGLRCGTA